MQPRTPRRSKQPHGKLPLQKQKAALRRTHVGFVTAFLLLVTAAVWFGLLLPGSAPPLPPAAARVGQQPPDMAGLQKGLAHADIPQPANPLISLVRSDGYSEADTQRMVAQATPTAPTTSVTTDYVYDGQNIVREMQRGTDGQLHPTATYLTGPRGTEYRRDDKTGQVRWYVYDGLGSVVGELDPGGNFTAGAKYDVYGAVRGRTGTATTSHGFVGSLGHLSEPETGLIYMRARYYDPAIGRFISEDPAGVGNNWFAYSDSNPTNETDKSGRSPLADEVTSMALDAGMSAGDGGGAAEAEQYAAKELGEAVGQHELDIMEWLDGGSFKYKPTGRGIEITSEDGYGNRKVFVDVVNNWEGTAGHPQGAHLDFQQLTDQGKWKSMQDAIELGLKSFKDWEY